MAALITNMSQPLGMAVGNSLEVIEAIETLQGKVGGRLLEVCLELGARMLILSELASSVEEGRAMLRDALSSGRALDKLAQMIEAQGGDASCTSDPWILPVACCSADIQAEEGGHVQRVDALTLGRAAMAMGAGRSRKEDNVDLACGIMVAKSISDAVSPGEPLARLYASSERLLREGLDIAGAAFAVGPEPVAAPPLVY